MTYITTELLKVWFIFSFSLGCWTCINLLVSRRGDDRVKYILISLILALLVPPLNAYVNLVNPTPVYWLTILSQKLTWIWGPILVSLIHHILLHPTNRLSYSIQILPMIFACAHDILNLQWLNIPTLVSILFIQVFSYLLYAAYLLKTQRAQLLKLTTQFKNTSYYWLIYLVASLFAIILFDVCIYTSAMLGNLPSFVALASIASLFAILVNTIALFSIYQPDVFFHDVVQPEEPTIVEKTLLRSIELSPDAAKQLDEQLQDLVKEHKPHLDEDISLPKLAALLGVTSHQLSELLNIHKSTSFYDFLNDLRYQESLHFLAAGETELTIADIAYRSGFNNRNSFYKVFKEKTGLTPSQYKKNHG